MKKKKNNLKALLTIIVIIAVIIGLVKHFRIDNFHIIKRDVLYCSGQPHGMDYTRLLYKYHIATFVNIRNADEHRSQNWYNEEITWMRENGANYIDLPIDRYGRTPSMPTAETIEKFTAIMSSPSNLPVLVHGSSGEKRIAMLVGAWMLKSGDFKLRKALKTAESIKGQKLTAYEIDFLKSFAE